MLDGYGPIPPSMARALVADGAESFHRVLTDPRDGAPLEIGRAAYRLPRPCGSGCGSGTAGVPSRAVTTPPWTTTRTTSWPGPTAAPPESPTSASPAGNTTASNTAPPGHPRGHQRQTTRLDLTLRTDLSQRTPGLGTTPLATPPPPTVDGPHKAPAPGPRPGSRPGPAPDPAGTLTWVSPPDPFRAGPFPAGARIPGRQQPEDPWVGLPFQSVRPQPIEAVSVG